MCELTGDTFDPDEAPVRFEDLSSDYKTAWNLYLEAKTQLVISPTGAPLGINILAIETLFRFYNVPQYKHARLYEKIIFIFNEIQDIIKKPEE